MATPLDFPDNPTIGQIYNAPNGVAYVWDGVKWNVVTGAGAGGGTTIITIGPTPPPNPQVGWLWWRNDPDGNLYVYYDDGTSAQWVPAVAALDANALWTVNPGSPDAPNYLDPYLEPTTAGQWVASGQGVWFGAPTNYNSPYIATYNNYLTYNIADNGFHFWSIGGKAQMTLAFNQGLGLSYNRPAGSPAGIPREALDVADVGAVLLGAARGTNPGTIQWNGTNFQGRNATAWVNLDAGAVPITQYYLVTGAVAGAPTASLSLGFYVAALAFTLPASLTGSQAIAKTAATAQTDVAILVNGISKGSIRWAVGATVATFVFASAVAIAVGDRIELVAPATPDATLADCTWTLRGTL